MKSKISWESSVKREYSTSSLTYSFGSSVALNSSFRAVAYWIYYGIIYVCIYSTSESSPKLE